MQATFDNESQPGFFNQPQMENSGTELRWFVRTNHFPESNLTTSQNPKPRPQKSKSGTCFGFWGVFWILGSVFGFWSVFLDSGFCPYMLPYKIVKAYLSELAGLLVTGLKMYTSSKIRYMRYTRPTLNEVKRSNSLHTKWPPEIQAKEKRK